MPATIQRGRSASLPLLLAGALAVAGCSGVGPQTVARDRFDYNGEVARSWKEQTLLNIVKSRYVDMPVFLEVAQIVSGYTLESSIALGATAGRSGAVLPPGDNLTLGTQGKWTDRPTITYVPLTGAQFNRNMLTPIPPAAVLFAMQAAWPIDLVFRVVVRSINGIDSRDGGGERYERLVTLLRTLQRINVIGMRMHGEKADQQAAVIFFRTRVLAPDEEAMVKEVRALLNLAPGRSDFRVTFGATPANDGEIAMLTRSMLQILVEFGEHVEVPEADVRDGRAPPSRVSTGGANGHLLRVKYSRERSPDALVQVPYRGGWFWIDDRDIASKLAFTLVMIFSTLAETGARESLPLVTIPAG
jgi:hypothetical protein